jgi:outer membrane protein TolC
MGLGSEFQLEVPYGPLPEPELQISRDEIIAAALARQSNLVRAVLFAKITGLEINAQRTSHHFQMDTFAAGGDIHSSQVEQGSHNSEYRVGAPLPEMPVKLVGSRDARVRRACSLNLRAQALVEKARNLVILEADNAFREWEEAAQQIPHVRKAATTGDRFADNLRKDFTAGLKVRVEEVINAQVLASQARAQYNEILFQQILALAKLEQITAGGFSAGLGWPPSIPVQVSGGNGKSASASGPR